MNDPDNSHSPTKNTTGGASRSFGSIESRTVISPVFEHREIVVAQGVEFQNHQLPKREKIPEGLKRMLPALKVADDGSAAYTNRRQRVHFTIRCVDTKSAYIEALETPGIHVIYDGHARYGRGPCFGPDKSPGDDWGNGTDIAQTGIWRMAFPYMAIPVGDILKHQYKTSAVAVDGEPPLREDCHPDIRARYSRLRPFTVNELARPRRGQTRSPLASFILSAGQKDDTEFWGLKKYYHGKVKKYVILHADWQETATTPYDLGGTDLQCRVFCHFGCSTFKHNYPVLRQLAGWERTDTDRFAYWTTSDSYGLVTGRWIYYLLTYRNRNAFQSWRPSLQFAVRRMRRYLRNRTFRII